jgi:hypothetical protein
MSLLVKSRHRLYGQESLLWAMNGFMRRSKGHLCSITLSACASREGRTGRPTIDGLEVDDKLGLRPACTHPGLPYESHQLEARDRKGSMSEVQH